MKLRPRAIRFTNTSARTYLAHALTDHSHYDRGG